MSFVNMSIFDISKKSHFSPQTLQRFANESILTRV